jgi:WD40 repeat protein
VLLISSLLVNRARVDAEAALAQKSELLYVADMVEAYDAWQHGWLDKVPGILARQLPPQGQRDYRGLEWHALDRQLGAANVTKMHAHLGAATEVTALGSGAAVASVGEDGYLRIWDVAKGKSQSIRIAGEPLHAIAATPDGQQIAVAGQAVYLVNLAEGSGPKIIKRFNHTVESMAFGPEAATLAVGVRYHEVCLLSPSGEVISRFDCDSRVDTLEYVPWLDGFLIASRKLQADGRGASVIQLWDTKLAQRKRQFTGNSSLGFSQLTYAKSLPERRQILVGSLYESKAGLLDAVSGSAVALVPIGRDQISTIACSPTGGRFAVAYAGGTVDMFNADSQQASSIVLRPEASVQAHRTGSITSMALLASGAVATSGADGQVNLWESPPGDHLWIHRENREIRSIAFSSAGTSLACGVADAVCVLSAEGKQRARWSMSETVEDIAWSPAGDAIVVCNSGSRHVDVFAPDGTKRLAIPVDGIARSAAYSPDGRWLAIVGENYLLLCDAASGALKRKVALTSPAEAIAISPCGKQIAIGGHRCYEIEIYGIDLLGSPEVLEVDRGVESLTYSADGSILVSGHADSVIRVWNTHAGRLASELVGHSLGVKKLVLSPEGRTLLSASSDGQLRAWSMPHCRLFGVLSHQPYIADHGSQGVGRPITVAISQRYLAIGKTGATDRSELTVWSLD